VRLRTLAASGLFCLLFLAAAKKWVVKQGCFLKKGMDAMCEAHSLKSALTYGINLALSPFLNTKKGESKLTFSNSNKTL
jgi:hypothetical protein